MPETNVHPASAVAALEAAIARLSAAQKNSRGVGASLSLIDPVRWTKQIEEADGNPAELERLRVLYDEKALSFMREWLRQQNATRQLYDALSSTYRCVQDVLAAHDAVAADDHRSPDQWLMPIMEQRIVQADELRKRPDREGYIDRDGPLFKLADSILVQTFDALAKTIVAAGPRRQYTTDLVVQGCKYETHLNRNVDLRSVYAVEFIDCDNSHHPANQRLVELLEQLEQALKAARIAQDRVKGNLNKYGADYSAIDSEIHNGTINEWQHAHRLVLGLHGELYGCGPSAEHVAIQNQARRRYEGVRQELLIASRRVKELHEQLAETLHAAVVEAQQLQNARITITDREKTVRICMNNCLAVDLRLRAVGREMKDIQGVYNRDLSHGEGRRAVKDRCAEVSGQYRPIRLTVPEASVSATDASASKTDASSST